MTSVSAVIRRCAGVALALLFASTAFWSLRLAFADFLAQRDTLSSVGKASAVTPENADLLFRLAELDPSRRRDTWESVVASDPYHSAAWIQLGLLAESEGDFTSAERHLLEAARVDQTFLPRWTLASYYFRRSDEPNFWTWAGAASRMSYGDTTALYQLCWRVTDDADLILDRVIPHESEPLIRYLLFLMKEDRLEAGMKVATLVMPMEGKYYLGVLVGYCERLIIRRDFPRALEAWNRLIDHGLVPYPPLSAAGGSPLTNSDFKASPAGRGFDWRPLSGDGYSVVHEPGRIRISLSGRQGGDCELLFQYMPVEPGATYRILPDWAPQPPPSEAGIQWLAGDPESGNVFPISGEPAEFHTTPETRFARLTLRYRRPLGAVTWEGEFSLRGVRLEKVARDPEAATADAD